MKRMRSISLALALCVPTCAYGSEAEIQELQERIAVLEYRVEALEAMVMGNGQDGNGQDGMTNQSSAEETVEEESENIDLSRDVECLTEQINKKIESEEFVSWQQLYQEFTGEEPKTPEVTHIMRYALNDFDGADVDCYLIDVSADVAFWMNEEAEQGAVDESFQLLIDVKTMKSYDNISTNAGNEQPDTTTNEGRANYLLWIYGNLREGDYNGNLVRDTESMIEMSAEDLAEINNNLG